MSALIALVGLAFCLTLLGISWGIVSPEALQHLTELFHIDRDDEGSDEP